jgi:hypothetical protein
VHACKCLYIRLCSWHLAPGAFSHLLHMYDILVCCVSYWCTPSSEYLYVLVWIPVLLYDVKTNNLKRRAYCIVRLTSMMALFTVRQRTMGFPTCALNDQFTANNLTITIELLRLLEFQNATKDQICSSEIPSLSGRCAAWTDLNAPNPI